MNKDIEQGINFMKYKNMFNENENNQLLFLSDTSSPALGSIVDAYRDGDNSLLKEGLVDMQTLHAKDASFNLLLTSYTTAYNTFVSSLTKTTYSSNDLALRASAEQNLTRIYNKLVDLGNSIMSDTSQLKAIDNNTSIQANHSTLLAKMAELSATQSTITSLDNQPSTIDGQLETSKLGTSSIQIHFIVYFLIAITIVAFTFYIVLNPNANVMNALYVVSILIAIYIISRWVI